MPQIPIELLESTHDFPCAYMFKVIGQEEHGFAARVVATIRDELGMEVDPPFSIRKSTKGRHVSITSEPMIQEAQQVIDVYDRLMKLDGLIMLW